MFPPEKVKDVDMTNGEEIIFDLLTVVVNCLDQFPPE